MLSFTILMMQRAVSKPVANCVSESKKLPGLCSYAIEIRDEVMLVFYLGLPHC